LQVAELVDNQQLGFAEKHQAISELPVGLGARQRRQERGGADEEDRVAGFDYGAPEGNREMRLADTRRAKDQDVFGLTEKAAGGELADEALIDRRLEFEIEIVERFHGREVRDLESHRDARALLGLDLLPQDGVEEVEIRRRGAGRIGEYRIEPLGDVPETQARELLDDPRMDNDTHRPAPVTTAS
jgi:hypothetical protein